MPSPHSPQTAVPGSSHEAGRIARPPPHADHAPHVPIVQLRVRAGPPGTHSLAHSSRSVVPAPHIVVGVQVASRTHALQPGPTQVWVPSSNCAPIIPMQKYVPQLRVLPITTEALLSSQSVA